MLMRRLVFATTFQWIIALLLLPAWLLVFWAFFDTESVRPRETVNLPVAWHQIWCMSPDGRAFLAPALGSIQGIGNQFTLALWSVATGEKLAELKGHTAEVRALAFSPDGTAVATISWDGSARVWDLDTGRERLTLRAGGKRPNLAVFYPDAKTLITGAPIKRWRLEDGMELDTPAFKTGFPLIRFRPGGQALVGLLGPRTVDLCDLDTGHEERAFAGFPPPLWTGVVSVSPDGQTVAIGLRDGSHGTIDLWDVATGQKWTSHKLRAEPITAGNTANLFSPDGRYLVVGQLSHPPLARLANQFSRRWRNWVEMQFRSEMHCAVLDVTTGECWQGLPYAFHIAFSPDCSTLYTIGDQGLQVWDVPPQRLRFSPIAWVFLMGALVMTATWWYLRRRQQRLTKGGQIKTPVATT
jgi:WD40 repeat protein